jgi:hypothetical protein
MTNIDCTHCIKTLILIVERDMIWPEMDKG